MEALYKLRIDSPYEILEIEDIKIKSIPNEHGYLYLKCLIDDNINERYSVEASTNDKIKVYEETNDKDEEATIFNGIIQNIITIHDNGVYYLEIEALTSSSELDIEEKSRSFQDVEMSYDELINEILKDYSGYSFTQCMDRPEEIGHPLFQYKETDFEFLKRIASYIGIDIHCDIINKNNMFYFGKPVKKELVLGDDIAYKSHQNIGAYNRARAERQINFSSIEYLYYEVKTKISSETGAVVWFKNVEFYVYSYESEYINGELIYTYRLCRKSAVWQEKIHNRKLKGISLEGEVLEVSGEHVKLHLSIDENQEVSKAAWFRYAPPTGNLMYSMPIVGTSARLYFSNEMCVEPIVTGCVRTNGSTCEQFSDTSNRYFVTESDNHLDMLPGAVNFSRPGLSVNLNDDDGISLNSSSSLYACAGSIILDAGKVLIIAKDKVTIDKNKQSTLSIENECYTDASGVVYENGSSREAFEAFTDDEPTAGVVAAFGVAAKALLAGAVAGINAAFSSLGGESTITAGEKKKFSTVDKLKSYGYGILGGISKFSTGCRQSMDWVGEHLLDYDRPNGEGGKSYRQISQENDARDEASYNELREKAPCKTAFEDSSNASETTLDLASLAMGVYGVKQLVSSGANYLRMNKSYINANISEAAQNSNILKQAINNVSKNSKGITLGSNGGNAGKYVSDVKGEFDALKNIKNGTKVAGSAKAGGSGSIDELVKACEGGNNSVNVELKYKDGWTTTQKAEADAKVKALTDAYTVKTPAKRSGTSASARYRSAYGKTSVLKGNDVDHTIDLQLGGADDILNMSPLDMSVNRSLGVQIKNAIKDYDVGTVFGDFTIH